MKKRHTPLLQREDCTGSFRCNQGLLRHREMGSWVQYDYSFYDETKKEKKPYKDRQLFSFQFLRVLFVQFLHLQVPDTPVLVLQLVPSTVNAELVWPDEESEDEEEDEEEDDDDELLEDPELESFLSLGQPAEQWPHSPVPVTWLPPSSTRVLHQNLPWVQKRFESKKSLGFQTSGSRSVIQLDLRVPPNRKGKTQGLPWPGPPGQLSFSQNYWWKWFLKHPWTSKKALSEFLKQEWLLKKEIFCLVDIRCCKYSKEQFLK